MDTSTCLLAVRSGVRAKCRSASQGFTLIELLITLTLIGILASISFQVSAAIHNSRLITTANALVTTLALARSETLKRQVPVSVCKSADGMQCSSSASWNDGWIVFADVNHDGFVGPDDTIVWIDHGGGSATRVVYRGFGSTRYITYLPSGFTNSQNGTFYICDHRGTGYTREVVLYKTGRVRAVGQSTAERARNCS